MIYKLTRDGETPHHFYSRCNGKGTIIIFIRNYSNGYRFNGITTVQLIGFGNNSFQRIEED